MRARRGRKKMKKKFSPKELFIYKKNGECEHEKRAGGVE